MAVNDAQGFAKLCDLAKKALENPKAKNVENTIFLKPAPKAKAN